jgi:hypothetical protein
LILARHLFGGKGVGGIHIYVFAWISWIMIAKAMTHSLIPPAVGQKDVKEVKEKNGKGFFYGWCRTSY